MNGRPWPEYDHVIVNRHIEASTDEMQAIIAAERLKRVRQPASPSSSTACAAADAELA